jgi:ABC-type multidrug transport system fused ATPase/permease subunit
MDPPAPSTVPTGPTTAPPPDNPLAVDQPGEQLVCEIKRHPIGIIGAYVAAGLALVVLAVVVFIVAPHLFDRVSSSRMALIGGLVFLLGAIIVAGFVFVTHTVYWSNRWIVSSDSITQVKRTSLFDKQTSQLSLADLEDITAEQDGPLAQMFHLGVLSAETAAATDKFTFLYCPNPTEYAKQILAARERFEETRRHDTGVVATPGSPPAAPAGY